MKRGLCLISTLFLLLNLCACGDGDVSAPSTEATQSSSPTTQPTTLPVPTESAVTTAPTPEPDPLTPTPHLETISRAEQLIYKGPSYEYATVDTVKIAGVYTIVEEVYDEDLNIWGRLKSGVGWVDLTNSRDPVAGTPTQSLANCFKFTAPSQPTRGDLEFTDPSNQYIHYFSMEALGDLFNISLHEGEINWDTGKSKIGKTLFSAPKLGVGQRFVAGISLPGDFSFCVVSCQDSAGVYHHYELYTSLKDGSLVANPFYP